MFVVDARRTRAKAEPMAVAAAAIPANGRVAARTPVRVTDARPWSTSQAPHPSPVTPAPTPMEATATPAAHWGTIRESGCGTGGVVPMTGTGVVSRKYVGVAGTSGRYASAIRRAASADASDSVRCFGSVVTVASVVIERAAPVAAGRSVGVRCAGLSNSSCAAVCGPVCGPFHTPRDVGIRAVRLCGCAGLSDPGQSREEAVGARLAGRSKAALLGEPLHLLGHPGAVAADLLQVRAQVLHGDGAGADRGEHPHHLVQELAGLLGRRLRGGRDWRVGSDRGEFGGHVQVGVLVVDELGLLVDQLRGRG